MGSNPTSSAISPILSKSAGVIGYFGRDQGSIVLTSHGAPGFDEEQADDEGREGAEEEEEEQA